MHTRRIPAALIITLVAAFIVAPSVIGYFTDWLWFAEVGYLQVFLGMLGTQAQLFVIVTLLSLLWLVPNLTTAVSAIGDIQPVFTTPEGMRFALPGRAQLRRIALNVSLALSVLIGLYGSSEWMVWLGWRHAQAFGQVDPILGHDVSFYMFTLPFLRFVQGLATAVVLLSGLIAGALYLVSGNLTSGFPARMTIRPGARRHLSLMAAAALALVAVGTWLGRAEFLLKANALFSGPGYADVHARIPAAAILAGALGLSSALLVLQAFSARTWAAAAGIGLSLIVWLGGEVYATALQRFVVTPNEQVSETPFIQHNIEATRRAFKLDHVETRELAGGVELTAAQIAANTSTLDNVRLWDTQPLLDTFGQMQEIRTYYDFTSIDIDRYMIDGVSRQVMLSARELNSASLPNRTWVNERLTFTHGYGLTLGPVNQVTAEGLPTLLVQNIPPESVGDLTITEPSIYFGELSNDYVIVRTGTKEFHYPKGDDNVFTTYAGKGGIALSSFWRKVLFAVRFGAYQMLLSNDITPDSRVLMHRNIRERVRPLAPFLSFDGDPYLVVSGGRMVWIYDAYTTSDRYPYATPAAPGLNYVRNAVKIVIDAYDGTTTMYLSDAQDPIAATWARAFPGIFHPMRDMPVDLRAHIRYPEDIFAIQASVYATYHMTQPDAFYNREDQWEIPSTDDSTREPRPMQPYYTIMRLPGEPHAEFIQMLPFTPRRKDNLSAWLVARSDDEHYGTLRVFQFPKQKVVFGPRQVIARINQDQEISPQVTLWNQQGSQVIWGTLTVIPIEESLIYVRPLYLRGEGGRIPELRRVVVAHQNQVVMEETFEAALAKLFGPTASASSGTRPTVAGTAAPSATGRPQAVADQAAPQAFADLASAARAHYDRAVAAQRAGDWATYGEQLTQLGEVLKRMAATRP